MSNYPDNMTFIDQPAVFTMYCHDPECMEYNKPQSRDGFIEGETGWGEPFNPLCIECDNDLHAWEDEHES